MPLSPAPARTIEWIDTLCCPDCRGALEIDNTATCKECGFHSASGQDLRPQSPSPRSIEVDLSRWQDPEAAFKQIPAEQPVITYDGPINGRDPRQLFSVLAEHCRPGDRLLDLGCGPKDQLSHATHAGYKYLGCDYSNPKADFLADAHSLPIKESSFDAVLSYSVFEHLWNPLLAFSEVSRILKPGGVFVGIVSQGEPFHQSYFHHTAWGILASTLTVKELELLRVWSSRDTLAALAKMGRYSRVVRSGLKALESVRRHTPFLSPRLMRSPSHDRALYDVYRAGSLGFLMRKPPTSKAA